MSFVGPRPPIASEVRKYDLKELKRLHFIPGITCIWQISGRSDLCFQKQVLLDLEYIQNYSVLNDLRILFLTIPAVLSARGAY